MNQKKQKAAGGKATDITAPKKQVVGTAPLVIPKRSIIGQQTADAEATEIAENETPAVTQPTTRKTILPVTVTDGSEADPADGAPSTSNATTDAPEAPANEPKTSDAAVDEPPKPDADTPPASTETSAAAPASTSEHETTPEDPDETDTDSESEEPESTKAKSKEELQAEQTAEAVKRERELQEYIKNQKYFVPVNAAEKKSIKISFGLVILLFLLAVVLVDLLLDTGAILLIQKIPHTHYFNLYH